MSSPPSSRFGRQEVGMTRKQDGEPLETLRESILKLLQHEPLTEKALARLLHQPEAIMKSTLAQMCFKNNEIYCKRLVGLTVYYIGEPPKAFWEVQDQTGHNLPRPRSG
jgi:hypothetical protein